MRPNYKQIARDCKQLIREGRDAAAVVRQCFEERVFVPEDFSFRDVALHTLGREFVEACDPSRDVNASAIIESDGVDVTAFSNITGQIMFSRILAGFNSPDFIGTSLIPNVPTRLNGEKLPGVTQLGDKGQVVEEGMPYPNFGIGEEFVETPETKNRGFIIPVTKAAIFFDHTNLILQRAGQVGESLGLNKEKRILQTLLGEASTFATGGKWKFKGTEYDVYETNTADYASYFYLNSFTDILSDYVDLDAVENMFGDIKDPNTEEAIVIPGTRTLLVVPNLRQSAKRIVNSTETRLGAANTITTLSPADKGDYNVKSSPLVKSLLESNKTTSWWVGNFGKAFNYMENWPITVSQAPPNNEAEFTRDIVARFKASERGAVAVIAPQYVIRSTGAGS